MRTGPSFGRCVLCIGAIRCQELGKAVLDGTCGNAASPLGGTAGNPTRVRA